MVMTLEDFSSRLAQAYDLHKSSIFGFVPYLLVIEFSIER